MKNVPEVKNILDSFPGIRIHSITKISETTEDNKSDQEIKIAEE